MPFPIIDRRRYWGYAGGITSLLVNFILIQLFYSYNYNTFSTNIRYRSFRAIFPFFVAYIFADAYASYRKQILKINLFDEYCYLRAKELVKQNEYLLDHPSINYFIQASRDTFGGRLTWMKLCRLYTDRPTTTTAVTSRTAS